MLGYIKHGCACKSPDATVPLTEVPVSFTNTFPHTISNLIKDTDAYTHSLSVPHGHTFPPILIITYTNTLTSILIVAYTNTFPQHFRYFFTNPHGHCYDKPNSYLEPYCKHHTYCPAQFEQYAVVQSFCNTHQKPHALPHPVSVTHSNQCGRCTYTGYVIVYRISMLIVVIIVSIQHVLHCRQ
jgi:hypothetical protein